MNGLPTAPRTRRVAIAGGVVVAAFVLAALLAPLIAPHPPDEQTGPPLSPPGTGHLLGTNDVGEDIASELIHGARVPLLVGAGAGTVAIVLAGLVGLLAGAGRNRLDAVLMRTTDLALVVPFIPLLVVAAAYLGRGLGLQILLIGALLWAAPARVIRAQVLSVATRPYVEAAATFGAGRGHVLRRHLLPAVAPLLIVEFVRAVQIAVLLEAALSFLGLGDPTHESWGTMLYYATSRGAFLTGAWRWWIVPPGLAVAVLVTACALVGLHLEERADPRLRTQMRRMTV